MAPTAAGQEPSRSSARRRRYCFGADLTPIAQGGEARPALDDAVCGDVGPAFEALTSPLSSIEVMRPHPSTPGDDVGEMPIRGPTKPKRTQAAFAHPRRSWLRKMSLKTLIMSRISTRKRKNHKKERAMLRGCATARPDAGQLIDPDIGARREP